MSINYYGKQNTSNSNKREEPCKNTNVPDISRNSDFKVTIHSPEITDFVSESDSYEKLYNIAIEASNNAYAPYSNFIVGAALLAKSGKIYTGVNIENASYGATICEERSAVCKAITDGEKDFTAIAIYSPNLKETFPCGICRQVLNEFSKDLDVIINYKTYKLNELLPYAFK